MYVHIQSVHASICMYVHIQCRRSDRNVVREREQQLRVCTHACARTCLYACMYLCTYACMLYICVCIYIYTHGAGVPIDMLLSELVFAPACIRIRV